MKHITTFHLVIGQQQITLDLMEEQASKLPPAAYPIKGPAVAWINGNTRYDSQAEFEQHTSKEPNKR